MIFFDGEPMCEPFVIDLICSQVEKDKLYLRLPIKERQIVIDKIVSKLSSGFIVYEHSDPHSILIMQLIDNGIAAVRKLIR